MAKVVAKFEKVSYEQFKKDWGDTFNASDEEIIRKIYDGIKLPKRATVGSAGYDFCCREERHHPRSGSRTGKDPAHSRQPERHQHPHR